jgi:ABC-type taurine transport system ATPase subunit
MAFLELKNVTKSYLQGAAPLPVLRNVSLTIEEGEFVALVGYSGSGKTTLIAALAGLTTPDAGEVLFKGRPVTGASPERAVVFQNYSLMPWLSVTGNVALAVDAVHGGRSRPERAALVARHVIRVGQHDLGARLGDLIRCHGLHRALGADWHEGRGLDRAVGRAETRPPGAPRIDLQELEAYVPARHGAEDSRRARLSS